MASLVAMVMIVPAAAEVALVLADMAWRRRRPHASAATLADEVEEWLREQWSSADGTQR